MELKGDRYTLSTGKVFAANRGILGLGPDGVLLYEGYDGLIEGVNAYGFYGERQPFTPEERWEVANAMILRWQTWAANTEKANV